MTDPKTLREIAEKTCIFDRAHFGDGNVPEPDVFLRHHESLKTDRKLITRLVPRFAVALGYFEGYAEAAEIASVMRRNIKEQIGAKPNENLFFAIDRVKRERVDELRTLQDRVASMSLVLDRDFIVLMIERTIDRIAKEGLTQANIGIVKKPPPPPPPVAPPKPNEETMAPRMPTDVHIETFCVRWIAAQSNMNDLGASHMTAMRAAVAHFVKPFERECETLRSLNRWQGDEIGRLRTALEGCERDIAEVHELMTANGVHVGDLKSRVLSMLGKSRVAESNDISNEFAQATADYANETDGMPKGDGDRELVRNVVDHEAESGSHDWDCYAKAFVAGARWQCTREKALSAQLRECEVRIDETEKERLAMKEERDRALAKVRAWEERTGETRPRIVGARLETASVRSLSSKTLIWEGDIKRYGNRCRVYSTGDVEYRTYDNHTNDPIWDEDCGDRIRAEALRVAIRERALETMLPSSRDAFVEEPSESIGVSDDVQAGSRGLSFEEAIQRYGICVSDDVVRRAAKHANVAHSVMWADGDERRAREALKLAIDMLSPWQRAVREFVGKEIMDGVNSVVAEPIDTSEKEAAPKSLYAENGSLKYRSPSGQETTIGDPTMPCSSDCEIVFRDDNEREYWDEMTFVLARNGDTTAESVANAADEMVEERRKRMPIRTVSEAAKTDASNDVLQMACAYANREMKFSASANDLVYAREALAGTGENGAWDSIVRAYVEGSSRKT